MTNSEEEKKRESAGPTSSIDDFAVEVDGERPGIVEELKDLIIHNKKWWLIPIIVVIGILSILVLLTQTAAAPFIYTIW